MMTLVGPILGVVIFWSLLLIGCSVVTPTSQDAAVRGAKSTVRPSPAGRTPAPVTVQGSTEEDTAPNKGAAVLAPTLVEASVASGNFPSGGQPAGTSFRSNPQRNGFYEAEGVSRAGELKWKFQAEGAVG